MNALIMDMLELSKFEVHAVQLKWDTVPLAALVRAAVESFSRQLELKGLRVRWLDDKDPRRVQADARRIEQVMLNLMSNAIRHARKNSVITIEIQRGTDGKVTTVVENVGASIPEEEMRRIWDHFYRAERSRDRKSGGTGLGLAIVKHILELHQSEYGVMNTEQGVAFYFTLWESRGDLQ